MLSFPKRNTSPRGDAAIRKCHTNTVAFVQLAKDVFGLLKKKKKFYDFCVSCRIKTEESANQSKGCDAKLKGLEYGSQLNFLNHTAHGHHLKGGRSPKYKTQSVVPAIWPVRRSFCFVRAWLYFGSNS